VKARRLLSLLVVGALAWVTPLPHAGAAAPTFRFYGAGYGHGVGMGAWGVYGMAQRGWQAPGILSHFYPGTTLTSHPDPAFIRVGLVKGVTSIPVQAWRGPAQVRLNDPTSGQLIGTIPAGATWNVIDRSGAYWVKRADGTYVGGHGWGDATHNLYVRFGALGSILYLPQRGFHFNRGFMELNIYKPCSTCASKERIILQLGTESYVDGVGEVPGTWPTAALRVFAIAARTYVTYKVNAVGQHRPGCNCGIWWVGEQYFIGYNRNLLPGAEAWLGAVAATNRRMVLWDGTPIVAAYSTSDGGYTQSNVEEWGGSQIPYLRSVCDPGDYVTPNAYKTWEVDLSQSTVTSRFLSHFHHPIGPITSFSVLQRAGNGRILSVRANGTGGSYSVSGNAFASALGLRTALVYVNVNKLVTGAVRQRYDWLMCKPGLPTTPVLHPGGGAAQHFVNGSIYADLGRGHSFYLYGLVDAKYRSLGGAGGSMGFPVTGVVWKGNLRTTRFVHGQITCNHVTGVCTVTHT